MAHKISRAVAVRILVSLFVAIAVTGISIWSAYNSVGAGYSAHWRVRADLRLMRTFASGYKHQEKRAATSLNEVIEANPRNNDILEQSRVDPWGREYHYEIVDNEVRLSTLGRDGKPGGRGLDADFTTDNYWPQSARLPLWQFLFEINSQGILIVCLIAGLLAGCLAYREFPSPQFQRKTWVNWLIAIAVWTWLSWFSAIAIAHLHLVPNGH